jgi:imidazolonepropionase
MKVLKGPFTQILPLSGMPLKGALRDDQLWVIPNGGILIENGLILAVGNFENLRKENPLIQLDEVTGYHVLLPGFVDCHTHICFAGSRAKDYASRRS